MSSCARAETLHESRTAAKPTSVCDRPVTYNWRNNAANAKRVKAGGANTTVSSVVVGAQLGSPHA